MADTGPCQYDDGTAHSADLFTVWYGAGEPATLCGKHTVNPIDFTRVRKTNR